MDEKPDFLEMASKEEVEVTPEPVPDTEAAEVSAERPKPIVTFMGNSYDLASVVAVTVGGVVLFTCFTCNMGFYCLPLIPVILGIIALVSAKDSVNPERTKKLSWIGIGSGVAIIILAVLAIVAYFVFIFFVIGLDSMSSGYGGF
jgi:hypothetical protein